jgi:hypothetical protein
MFLALGMIALAMVFGCGAMRFRRILVVFRRFVVFVSGHLFPRSFCVLLR